MVSVSRLIKCLSHVEFIFVCSERVYSLCSDYIDSRAAVQLSLNTTC